MFDDHDDNGDAGHGQSNPFQGLIWAVIVLTLVIIGYCIGYG